jgi:hypothetical protein
MTGGMGRGAARIAILAVLAALSAVALFAMPAEAAQQRWRDIPGKTGEERILYDADSVVPSGPDRYRVWVTGFEKDRFPRKSQEEYDCRNRIFRDIEVIVEKPGKPATHTFTPTEWRDVPRDTPRGELLKILCR